MMKFDQVKVLAMLESLLPARNDIAATLERRHGAGVSTAYVKLCGFMLDYRQATSTFNQLCKLLDDTERQSPAMQLLHAVHTDKSNAMVLEYCALLEQCYGLSDDDGKIVQSYCIQHIERFDNILATIAKGATE